MVLGKLSVPGFPTILDYSRARAFCACSRCGSGLFGYFYSHLSFLSSFSRGRSGGAKVLGKFPVPGRPTILITVGQGPTALAECAGGGCLDIFTLVYPFSSLAPSLWETARYRLKYCLKGPLNPKQPTNNQPLSPCLRETARYRLKYCLKRPLSPNQPPIYNK